MRKTGTITYSDNNDALFTSLHHGDKSEFELYEGQTWSMGHQMVLLRGCMYGGLGEREYRLVAMAIPEADQSLPLNDLKAKYVSTKGVVLRPGVGRLACNEQALRSGLWHSGPPLMENPADRLFMHLGISRKSAGFEAVGDTFNAMSMQGAGESDRTDVILSEFFYVADRDTVELDASPEVGFKPLRQCTWLAKFARREYIGGRKDVVLIKFKFVEGATDWQEVRSDLEAALGFKLPG